MTVLDTVKKEAERAGVPFPARLTLTGAAIHIERLEATLLEIIERLEQGQLAEPHAVACLALGIQRPDTPHKDKFYLESEAFREVLESYACPGIGKCPERVMKDGTCIKAMIGGCGDEAARVLAEHPHFLAEPVTSQSSGMGGK